MLLASDALKRKGRQTPSFFHLQTVLCQAGLIRFCQRFVGVFAAVQLVVDFVVMLEVLRQQ